MTTLVPPSSFLTSQGRRPTSSALIQPPRRQVRLTNRYGNQRRPLPTPTQHKKKSVRFCSDNDLEQVRLFIKTQTPLAAAHDPPRKRWEISYPGWPSKWAMYKSLANPTTTAIKMEHIMLSNDNGSLKGHCRVANLAYEKQVVVRYSFDDWQTFREQFATYREPVIASPGWDRFTFEIPVSVEAPTTFVACSMALRYQTIGQTFWDNNDGHNYQVHLTNEGEKNDYFLYDPSLTSRSLSAGYDHFISNCFL